MKKHIPVPVSLDTRPKLLRHFSKEDRKKMVLSGQTTAGPLAVLMYEKPRVFWVGAFVIIAVFSVAIWTLLS